MKILVVTPSFPIPETGAEQADRAEGLRQLVRLGHEVYVIAKVVQWANTEYIYRVSKEMGIHISLVPYRYSNRALSLGEQWNKFWGKFRNPLYFDGAAYEYAEPVITRIFAEAIRTIKPDAVWFEYTYLWPLYKIAKHYRVPIITRSINYEPAHFLDEDGRTALNYIKVIWKFLSERKCVRESNAILAITPQEEALYTQMDAKHVSVLPLRSLSRLTTTPTSVVHDRSPLRVFFMGSSYSVTHNKAAAKQVVAEIAPEIERRLPGQFVFHIFGAKLPEELKAFCDGSHVVYEGYVDNLAERLADMDIALIPSLMGAGMQQKVFEPMTRGIPTITSPRAIAGYSLKDGMHYLAAHATEDFVRQLLSLREVGRRAEIAATGSAKTRELFSQDKLDTVVKSALESL